MDDNTQDVNTQVASNSSPEAGEGTPVKAGVPVENRIAELTRKFSKLERSIDDKLNQLLSSIPTSFSSSADKATPIYTQEAPLSSEYITKGEYYKHRDTEEYAKLKSIYPELDKNSEKFDPEFFNLADMYYNEFSSSKNPILRNKAVEKAIQQASVETGKFQQLERNKALTDEVRRSRLLGEGTIAPKAVQKDSSNLPENVKTLAKLFGIDEKRLKQEYK